MTEMSQWSSEEELRIIMEDSEPDETSNVPKSTVDRDDDENRAPERNPPRIRWKRWDEEDYVSIRASSSCDRSSPLFSPERAVTPLPYLIIERQEESRYFSDLDDSSLNMKAVVVSYMRYVRSQGIDTLSDYSDSSRCGQENTLLDVEKNNSGSPRNESIREGLKDFPDTLFTENHSAVELEPRAELNRPNNEFIKEVIGYSISRGQYYLRTFQDVEDEGPDDSPNAEHGDRPCHNPGKLSCVIDQAVRKSDPPEKIGESIESFRRIWNDTPEGHFDINAERRLSEPAFDVPQLDVGDIVVEGLTIEAGSGQELQPTTSRQPTIPTINVVDGDDESPRAGNDRRSFLNVSQKRRSVKKIDDEFVTTRSKKLIIASSDGDGGSNVPSPEAGDRTSEMADSPEYSSGRFKIMRLCKCKRHTCGPYKPNKIRRRY